MVEDTEAKKHLELLLEGQVVWNSERADNPFHPYLRNVDLYNHDLSGYNLSGADFRGSDLTFVKFEGAKLDKANFEDVILESRESSKSPFDAGFSSGFARNPPTPSQFFFDQIKLANFSTHLVFPNGATYTSSEVAEGAEYPVDASVETVYEDTKYAEEGYVEKGYVLDGGGDLDDQPTVKDRLILEGEPAAETVLQGEPASIDPIIGNPTVATTPSRTNTYVKSLLANPVLTHLSAYNAVTQIDEAIEYYVRKSGANKLPEELEVLKNIRYTYVKVPIILQSYESSSKREAALEELVKELKEQVAELTKKLKATNSPTRIDKFKDSLATSAGKSIGDWKLWVAVIYSASNFIGGDTIEAKELTDAAVEICGSPPAIEIQTPITQTQLSPEVTKKLR